MRVQNKFSCFVIGEGKLPIQCAELILERGHQIFGLISSDASVTDWAKGKHIPHIQSTNNPIAFLSQQPFDYLFSIVNSLVLPKEILDLPRQYAINYHDAPLPRYAGVNATSWALMHQEKTHSITWHLITNLVDGGDILKQFSIEITDDETAFTLNGKCYEAAIRSFSQLIDELSNHNILLNKQNLDERTYFSRSKKPSAGGAFSFNHFAHHIDAFVRSLDFGPYPNPLTLPKLVVGSDFIIVPKVEVKGELSESPPGTITAIESSFLQVSTVSYDVALAKVLTIDGQILSITDLVARFGLQVGYQFKDIELDIARHIDAFYGLSAKHEAFWVERLAMLKPISIPYAGRTASHLKQKRYASVKMPVSPEFITFLEECYPGWNRGDFLFAAFVIYLARIGGTECFDIGFRDVELQRELVGLEGFFASIVPCRIDINYKQSFEEVFSALRKLVESLKLHNTYARDAVVRYPALRSLLELGCKQMFSVIVERVEKLGDSPTETRRDRIALSGNELTLVIPSDAKECCWFYNTEVLDGDIIARMLDQFTTFLQGIVTNPAQQVAYLPLLSEQERHKILVEWNHTQVDYPQDICVHQLFEAQVELTPDAIAVVFENQQLTYRELNCRANKIAHHLQKLGVGSEVLAGICIERSLEMVVGLLGILKAGGAYVPLDPAYPKERLAFMLQDSQVRVLLTQQQLIEKLPEHKAQVICLDTDWEVINQENQENPTSEVTADNLVYVMYTSGSTGKPKGVSVIHRGVVRLVKGANYANLTAEEVFLQLAPISFDASSFEIWGCLLNGGRLAISPPGIPSLEELGQAIRQHQVTTLWLTAGLFQLMVDQRLEDLKPVRQLLAGGDVLSVPHVQKVLRELPDCKLINGYGPTENTTFTCCYSIIESSHLRITVPIGRPITDTQIYLLDRHLQPVPVGLPGELYIGGAGLARGYLNRLELTAEYFTPNPFSNEPGARLYKTGDLARYLPDGNIEFLGRLDNQIKIRGFRIELGEIEAVLSQHSTVQKTVVIAREDVPGDRRLVAYIVPQQEIVPTSSELHRFLKQKLPDYMVPSSFVMLDTLPLTPNSKVDRHALPTPQWRPEESLNYVSPRTPIEEILIALWGKVLGAESVGVYDNFFELGGHSLLATQLISRVRATLGVELSLSSLFKAPTIARVAECIETALRLGQSLPASPLSPIPRGGKMPLSFAQQRLWFLYQLQPNSSFYNIPLAVRLSGSLNVTALEQSLKEIIRRHEALRINFTTVEGQPVAVITSTLSLTLPVVDLRSLPSSEREIVCQQLATSEAQRSFNLASEPLVRASLLQLAEAEQILLLTIHHIVSDGWSLGVFFRELSALYEACCNDLPSPLSQLPIQYLDFVAWQRQWLTGEVLQSQLAYWKQQLKGATALLELPTDRPRPAVSTFRGAHLSASLSKELSQKLASLSQRSGVTLFMTLLAAFQTLLYRYTGQDDICVGTPIANRDRAEIEGLIGLFANTLVLRTDLSNNPSFEQLLNRVREVALGAYAHQEMPFEQLVEALQPVRDLSHTPLFQVMFGFQNTPMTAFELQGLTATTLAVENFTAKFDLTLSIENTEQGLIGYWEYNSDLFNAATITRMAEHFQTLLQGIVTNSQQRLCDLPLLTESERHQLLVEWNDIQQDYPLNECIHQLFEAQVVQRPDTVAVVFEGEQLTYRELNSRANQLAHYLKNLGVGPEVLVGICVERSFEMVVGLLGILKAGGAYVPLDPTYPQERLLFMLEDSQVPVLLTQAHLVESLPKHQARIVCLDTDWGLKAQQNHDNPINRVTPECLVYVMYTSGSTGTPKGVSVVHRGVVRLVKETNYAHLSAEEVFLQLAPISFDASTFEIWGCLLNGARLVVMPPHIPSLQELGQALGRYQISTLWLTASLFHLMVDERIEDLKNVRQLLAGGDVLSVPHVKKVVQELKECRLINGYGPTENTTFTCCYPVTDLSNVGNSVPIGRPITNTQIYLLDRHLQPVPIGVPGELYIGGAGLARGYLNRSQLTAERFIPNLFSEEARSRLYKTGDLVRYLPDGNIEFLGRIDHQVKIRGFRIELEEIETVLAQHPSVHRAVVIVREDIPDQKCLIAYLVAKQQLALQISELRCFLKEKLPDYMIPTSFVMMDALPLMPNGKLDRYALPAPHQVKQEPETIFLAPQDELELQLAKIWRKVLGIQSIGIQDNFFDLGGNSLLVVRLLTQIQKTFGKNLPLATLFQAPTVEQLANILRQEEYSKPWSSIAAIQPDGSKLPFFFVPAVAGVELARHLGLEQPFYGIQLPGPFYGIELPRADEINSVDIKGMAVRFVEGLRSVQSHGPYFLGGRCLGGVVAFEMAQQLQAQHQQVALLALIDTPCPNTPRPNSPSINIPYRIADRFIHHWRILLQLSPTEKLAYVLKHLRSGKENFYRLKVLKAYVQTMYNYRAQPYSGRMALFLASEEPVNAAPDPRLYWSELATGELETHMVSGNHDTVLREPYVQVLAAKLKDCFERCT